MPRLSAVLEIGGDVSMRAGGKGVVQASMGSIGSVP